MSYLYLTSVAVDILLKTTTILLAALLVARMLQHRSAAARHTIWTMAVLATLAVPVASVCLPGWGPSRPFIGATHQAPTATASVPVQNDVLPAVDRNPLPQLASVAVERLSSANRTEALHIPVAASRTPDASPRTSSQAAAAPYWPWALGAAWVSGVLLMIIPLIAGLVRLRLLCGQSETVRSPTWCRSLVHAAACLRLRRRVQLRSAAHEFGPLTAGVVRPLVLLPELAKSWTDDTQRAVLLHELAHIKRWDVLTQWVARLARALFWFHPLVWFAARQMRIERERACDDLVLTAGTKATDYSQQLLAIVADARPAGLLAASALGLQGTDHLRDRVARILDRGRDRRPISKPALVATGMIAALLTVSVATAGKVVVHDKEGNVVAAVTIPDGGSVTVSPTTSKLGQGGEADPVPPTPTPGDDANATSKNRAAGSQPFKLDAQSLAMLNDWIQNPVDAMLYQQFLRTGGKASREEFVRRAYFDTLGRPPTQEELDAFTDDSIQSRRRLLAGLLGMPRDDVHRAWWGAGMAWRTPACAQCHAAQPDSETGWYDSVPELCHRQAWQAWLGLNRKQTLNQEAYGQYALWFRQAMDQDLARELYTLLWHRLVASPNATQLPSEARARKVAQYVVNLVDALDDDSQATRFRYDPNLSDGWTEDESQLKEVVGVESPPPEEPAQPMPTAEYALRFLATPPPQSLSAEELAELLLFLDQGKKAEEGTNEDGPDDNGPIDEGPIDEGPIDEGPIDEGPIDEGPIDEGPIDEGS